MFLATVFPISDSIKVLANVFTSSKLPSLTASFIFLCKFLAPLRAFPDLPIAAAGSVNIKIPASIVPEISLSIVGLSTPN